MSAIAFSQFRKHLTETAYLAECGPVTITRADGKNLVLLSESEYSSILETLYLTSSAENARILKASIAEADRGEFVEVEL